MSLLLVWSLRALAAIAAGCLVALLLRRRSAALRNVVLRMTLVVATALPLIGLYAPRVPVSLPAPPTTAPTPMAPAPMVRPSASALPATPKAIQGPEAAEPAIIERDPAISHIPVAVLILTLYALGVLALVSRWLYGWRKLLAIAGKATRLPGEPDVLLGDIAVPATFGRIILLPTSSLDWPESRREAAILHERAHLRRRDWGWQTFASLFAAVHWFNPAGWLLAQSLRDTAEAAADDEVLAAGLSPSGYAKELLEVAKTVASTGPALAMARRGGVRDRVVEVLSPKRDRRRPTRLHLAVLVPAMALTGLAVAGIESATGQESGSSRRKSLAIAPSHGPFKLSDGRTLRLAAVFDPSIKDRAWTPDGARLSPSDFRRLLRDPMRSGPSSENTLPCLGLVFLVSGPDRKLDFTLDPPGSTSWSLTSDGRSTALGKTLQAGVSIPKVKEKFDLRVGYTSGEIHEERLRFRTGKADSSFFESGRSQPLIRVHLLKPLPTTGFHQVVAYDKEGRRIREFVAGSDGLPFYDLMAKTSPARVVHRLKTYEWIDVRGIPCAPRAVPSPSTPRVQSTVFSAAGRSNRGWTKVGAPGPVASDTEEIITRPTRGRPRKSV